jgi:hypothetical protein
VDVQQARQYLERQVQMFAAVPEVDADGDTFIVPQAASSPSCC